MQTIFNYLPRHAPTTSWQPAQRKQSHRPGPEHGPDAGRVGLQGPVLLLPVPVPGEPGVPVLVQRVPEALRVGDGQEVHRLRTDNEVLPYSEAELMRLKVETVKKKLQPKFREKIADKVTIMFLTLYFN